MLQTTKSLYIIDCLKETAKTPYVAIVATNRNIVAINRNMFSNYEIIFGNIDDINENIVDRIFQYDYFNKTALTYASVYIVDIYTKPSKKLPTIFDNLSILDLIAKDIYLSTQPNKFDIIGVVQKNRYGRCDIHTDTDKYYIVDNCLHIKNSDFVLDLNTIALS